MAIPKTKQCVRCKEFKPLTPLYFPTRKSRSKNPARTYITWCIPCKNKWWREWVAKHKEYRKRKHEKQKMEWHTNKNSPEFQMKERARRLNVSVDVLRPLWDTWVCAICGESPERLEVDHNHITGQVRELLCGLHNKMIGLAKENPEHLRKGAEYLERFMKV